MFASLGLVTVMRIPILAFGAFVMEPTLQFFICVAFYTPYFWVKVYLKLDDVLIKKIILGLLFISGYVIDKLVTDRCLMQAPIKHTLKMHL
jgi:branched-subunit amino acid ABC-type transport system permease component